MCFSAVASFTASAFLGALGFLLVRKHYQTKRTLLAIIPFFFAFQQLSEGVLWLSLEGSNGLDAWGQISQKIYLFFAYLFWPFYLPLAFFAAERSPERKKLLLINTVIGLIYSIGAAYDIHQGPLHPAEIVHQSIQYGSSGLGIKILYAVIALMPFFISSIKWVWLFGIVGGLAFVISAVFFYYAFTSVWCFAAALITCGAFLIAREK